MISIFFDSFIGIRVFDIILCVLANYTKLRININVDIDLVVRVFILVLRDNLTGLLLLVIAIDEFVQTQTWFIAFDLFYTFFQSFLIDFGFIQVEKTYKGFGYFEKCRSWLFWAM